MDSNSQYRIAFTLEQLPSARRNKGKTQYAAHAVQLWGKGRLYPQGDAGEDAGALPGKSIVGQPLTAGT